MLGPTSIGVPDERRTSMACGSLNSSDAADPGRAALDCFQPGPYLESRSWAPKHAGAVLRAVGAPGPRRLSLLTAADCSSNCTQRGRQGGQESRQAELSTAEAPAKRQLHLETSSWRGGHRVGFGDANLLPRAFRRPPSRPHRPHLTLGSPVDDARTLAHAWPADERVPLVVTIGCTSPRPPRPPASLVVPALDRSSRSGGAGGTDGQLPHAARLTRLPPGPQKQGCRCPPLGRAEGDWNHGQQFPGAGGGPLIPAWPKTWKDRRGLLAVSLPSLSGYRRAAGRAYGDRVGPRRRLGAGHRLDHPGEARAGFMRSSWWNRR